MDASVLCTAKPVLPETSSISDMYLYIFFDKEFRGGQPSIADHIIRVRKQINILVFIVVISAISVYVHENPRLTQAYLNLIWLTEAN
jgi:hypothetical protein